MKYPILALVLVAASCAAPSASQGTAGQGGSVHAPEIIVTVNIGGAGGPVTGTSAPTAAPAASSEATATQPSTATVTPSANLGDSAIKAVLPSAVVPVLGAKAEKKPEPAPLPAPTPAPAPVEPPK